MEVSQVVDLANWFQKNSKIVDAKFSELVGILQNNSQQSTQMPVTQPLRELSRALADMPTSELSTMQIRVLEDLGVANLVGKRGRAWVNNRVRATTYDPATTFQSIQEAYQRIKDARQKLIDFKNAAERIGFNVDYMIDAPTPYVFNVIFQKDAEIKNVRDWKKTAADWELIIAGVTAVAKEKPEDVFVVGAQNGSIIYTLSATPIVTKILAMISKHIASIANDYLDFQMKREELRRSRMMSEAIEADLKRQEDLRRSEGKSRIVDAIQQMAPDATPEEMAKLEKSIDRQITFHESGGEVDFVLPSETTENGGDLDASFAQDAQEVRNIIQEYRSELQKARLITHIEEDKEENFDDD